MNDLLLIWAFVQVLNSDNKQIIKVESCHGMIIDSFLFLLLSPLFLADWRLVFCNPSTQSTNDFDTVDHGHLLTEIEYSGVLGYSREEWPNYHQGNMNTEVTKSVIKMPLLKEPSHP